ncbi:citrate lyase subunit beta/citryl-CoA lyase [Neorhizobium galegae]|uniref:aldolase/citrate lyase family protein n=1 Tax=Neorhizobium galegae TaxID=399 RepID=UPI001AE3C449|nr:aldolase/citrate lyase family protein [Neorhizobium galegae]MBP2549517.1 citrate lyase subunit beta/citryl-CoA lyase [Neorhizobium galegae]
MDLHGRALSRKGEPVGEHKSLAVLLPPLTDAGIEDAIRAAMRWHARTVILPQVTQAALLQHLDVLLTVIEAEENLPGPPLRIAACPADTPEGAAFVRDFRRMSARLEALIWDGPAFCRAMGLSSPLTAGEEPQTLRTARSLFLMSAKAAGVLVVDTGSNIEDADAFAAECRFAKEQGFEAMISTSPMQAEVIDEVFGVSA